MKAIIQKKYGSPDKVLALQEMTQPTIGDNEVLVKVKAASVHPDVWHVVTGRPFILRLIGGTLFKPKNPVPGSDMAGIIDSVGKDVSQFKVGDEVFGETHSGLQWQNAGAFAEYVAVPENTLALKPAEVTFEQAAAVPTSGIIALFNLQNDSKILPGHNVLINGAAGSVGSIALQFAKAHGAKVTAVDHTDKINILETLGADHVIDYTKENFIDNTDKYDLIFDVASNLSFSDCKRKLSPEGKYVLIGHDHYGKATGPILGSIPRFFKLIFLSMFVKQLPKEGSWAPDKKKIIASLRELLANKKLTPIIDSRYPLSEVVNAMHRLESGLAQGKVIIVP